MVLSASDGACTRLPLRPKGWQPGGDWVRILDCKYSAIFTRDAVVCWKPTQSNISNQNHQFQRLDTLWYMIGLYQSVIALILDSTFRCDQQAPGCRTMLAMLLGPRHQGSNNTSGMFVCVVPIRCSDLMIIGSWPTIIIVPMSSPIYWYFWYHMPKCLCVCVFRFGLFF